MGDIRGYKDNPTPKKLLFFESLRVYKLVSLLRLHIIAKARNIENRKVLKK